MKIEKIKHTGVNKDGTSSTGAIPVETAGKISMSADNGGCGVPGCKCSPGHWIHIHLPRKGSTVECIKVEFENREELENFLKLRQLVCQTKKK